MTIRDQFYFDLVVRGGGRIHHVRLPFDPPLTSADQLRPALVALAQRTRASCNYRGTNHDHNRKPHLCKPSVRRTI